MLTAKAQKFRKNAKRILACFLAISFLSQNCIYSAYGQLGPINLTSSPFNPPVLRYLSVNSSNPFNYFNFLLDRGDTQGLSPQGTVPNLTSEAKQLINYFFLGITLPDNAFWVNLRPDEPGRITSEELSSTDMGKVLLEQDLQLKRDMARYLHPLNTKGKEFWEKLYATIGKDKVKRAEITTSNRVWIVPDEAVVMETEDGAFVAEAKLKVMLENEYLSAQKGLSTQLPNTNETQGTVPLSQNTQLLSEQLMREIIIPAITQDVNTSQAYASLRQIYNSLILAQWFKRKHKTSNSVYSFCIDKGYLKGLESQLPWSKQALWQEYLESYSKGEYKLKEKLAGLNRMYWSGGIAFFGPGAEQSGSSPITIITDRSVFSLGGDGLRKLEVVLEKTSIALEGEKFPIGETITLRRPKKEIAELSQPEPSVPSLSKNEGEITPSAIKINTLPFIKKVTSFFATVAILSLVALPLPASAFKLILPTKDNPQLLMVETEGGDTLKGIIKQLAKESKVKVSKEQVLELIQKIKDHNPNMIVIDNFIVPGQKLNVTPMVGPLGLIAILNKSELIATQTINIQGKEIKTYFFKPLDKRLEYPAAAYISGINTVVFNVEIGREYIDGLRDRSRKPSKYFPGRDKVVTDLLAGKSDETLLEAHLKEGYYHEITHALTSENITAGQVDDKIEGIISKSKYKIYFNDEMWETKYRLKFELAAMLAQIAYTSQAKVTLGNIGVLAIEPVEEWAAYDPQYHYAAQLITEMLFEKLGYQEYIVKEETKPDNSGVIIGKDEELIRQDYEKGIYFNRENYKYLFKFMHTFSDKQINDAAREVYEVIYGKLPPLDLIRIPEDVEKEIMKNVKKSGSSPLEQKAPSASSALVQPNETTPSSTKIKTPAFIKKATSFIMTAGILLLLALPAPAFMFRDAPSKGGIPQIIVGTEEGDTLERIVRQFAGALQINVNDDQIRELIQEIKEHNPEIQEDNNGDLRAGQKFNIDSVIWSLELINILSKYPVIATQTLNVNNKEIKTYFIRDSNRSYEPVGKLYPDIDTIVINITKIIDGVEKLQSIIPRRSWLVGKSDYNIAEDHLKRVYYHELGHVVTTEDIAKGRIGGAVEDMLREVLSKVNSVDEMEGLKYWLIYEVAGYLAEITYSSQSKVVLMNIFPILDSEVPPSYLYLGRLITSMLSNELGYQEYIIKEEAKPDNNGVISGKDEESIRQDYEKGVYFGRNYYRQFVDFMDTLSNEQIKAAARKAYEGIYGELPSFDLVQIPEKVRRELIIEIEKQKVKKSGSSPLEQKAQSASSAVEESVDASSPLAEQDGFSSSLPQASSSIGKGVVEVIYFRHVEPDSVAKNIVPQLEEKLQEAKKKQRKLIVFLESGSFYQETKELEDLELFARKIGAENKITLLTDEQYRPQLQRYFEEYILKPMQRFSGLLHQAYKRRAIPHPDTRPPHYRPIDRFLAEHRIDTWHEEPDFEGWRLHLLAYLEYSSVNETYAQRNLSGFITAVRKQIEYETASVKSCDTHVLNQLKKIATPDVTVVVIRGASHPMIASEELGYDLHILQESGLSLLAPANQITVTRLLGKELSQNEEEIMILQGVPYAQLFRMLREINPSLTDIEIIPFSTGIVKRWNRQDLEEFFYLKDKVTMEVFIKNWIMHYGTELEKRQLKLSSSPLGEPNKSTSSEINNDDNTGNLPVLADKSSQLFEGSETIRAFGDVLGQATFDRSIGLSGDREQARNDIKAMSKTILDETDKLLAKDLAQWKPLTDASTLVKGDIVRYTWKNGKKEMVRYSHSVPQESYNMTTGEKTTIGAFYYYTALEDMPGTYSAFTIGDIEQGRIEVLVSSERNFSLTGVRFATKDDVYRLIKDGRVGWVPLEDASKLRRGDIILDAETGGDQLYRFEETMWSALKRLYGYDSENNGKSLVFDMQLGFERTIIIDKTRNLQVLVRNVTGNQRLLSDTNEALPHSQGGNEESGLGASSAVVVENKDNLVASPLDLAPKDSVKNGDALPKAEGEGGIDLSNIELTLKDEKFVSSLNPADLKVLRAAKALKDGWESLSLLYVHEIMLLLKDNLIQDIQNKELLFNILEQLKIKEFLDPQALQFLQFIQSQRPLTEIKVTLYQ